ncbi:hypothetical protein LXL04_007741 [Taraxacum kok-saghyz]
MIYKSKAQLYKKDSIEVSTDSDSDAWFGGSHSYDFRQKEKHIGIMQVLDVRHMELFLTEEYQKGSCEVSKHYAKLPYDMDFDTLSFGWAVSHELGKFTKLSAYPPRFPSLSCRSIGIRNLFLTLCLFAPVFNSHSPGSFIGVTVQQSIIVHLDWFFVHLPSLAFATPAIPRTIRIIHPPPDIRKIVDKTASFVAKNVPEFEKRIIISHAGNPKFNFLNGSDPYHAYYQHRLAEFRSQNQNPTDVPPLETAAPATDLPETIDPSAKFRPVKRILDPPEAEQYIIRLPEGITGEELDIIKLTAQFVARNGKSLMFFTTSLRSTISSSETSP